MLMKRSILCLLCLLPAAPCLADPLQISTCGESCVLTIPRHKIFMSQNNPSHLWLAFANRRYENFKKSTDGGLSWNATEPDALTVKEYLNYHASIAGDSQDNVYYADVGSGGAYFRKVTAPGESASSFGPLQLLTPALEPPMPEDMNVYANVLAQDQNNIWIITRTRLDAMGNIRYFRSQNGGSSFTQGWVEQVNAEDVRIGSLLINNQPAVVVKYNSPKPPGDPIDYRYFIWNGSQFIRNIDADIVFNQGIAFDRGYSMAYVNGYMHFTYNQGRVLRHAWKQYGNGSALWQYGIVDQVSTAEGTPDWHGSLSRHGSDLYAIYTRQDAETLYSNNVYLRKWTGSQWGPAVQLTSDGLCNRYPHSAQIINPSADYLPIVWMKAEAGTCANPSVYYVRHPLDGSSDSTVPAAPQNLAIVP